MDDDDLRLASSRSSRLLAQLDDMLGHGPMADDIFEQWLMKQQVCATAIAFEKLCEELVKCINSLVVEMHAADDDSYDSE